ncbi:MAG: 2OG-Fe(II) oxygenase family protein [Actinomycetota bacterium]
MTSETFDAEAKERELRAESESWDTSTPTPARPDDVPVVDVGPWFRSGAPADLAAAAGELRRACEDVGFHQLVGHGLDPSERAGILDVNRRFHDLDEATKTSIAMDRPGHPVGGVGYLPYGNRKLPTRSTGNRNAAFLLKSGAGIGIDDNQWLPDEVLPGFRTAVERYARLVTDLAMRLLPVYAVALDLEPDFFEPAFGDPFWRLRLTHYPPSEPSADTEGGENGGFGIAPHVDTTFFTLLLTDGPGLVIQQRERDEWITVPAVDDAVIVNSGELLRQWSNDRFLSTRHFADNPSDGDRYSVPYFFNATADHVMAVFPSCHGPDDPPRYPPFSYLQSQGVVQGE